MTCDQALAPMRRRGQRAIAAFMLVNVAAVAPVGLLLGNADWWIIQILAICAAAVPLFSCVRGRCTDQTRTAAGLALTCFPILYVYLFKGDPWQMDTHMYFLVCFSLMILMCDPRPIIAGAALTIVHHLVFFLWMPEWVFPGSGSIGRVLFHGSLVVCQVSILLTAVRLITSLTMETQGAHAEANRAREQAEQARAQAEHAREEAEQALQASRLAEQRAEEEHRVRLEAEAALKLASDDRRLATAAEIEESIGALIGDLTQVADQFACQAGDMTSVSGVLAIEARDLQSASEDAVDSISAMVRNAEELAESIRLVGKNAGRAQSVASDTVQSIATLGPGLEALSAEVDAAQSILQLVSEIASQSNLLALNATIEAARSGEAGRGFGVVAAEMKQMALATSRAADDISVKLQGIVTAAERFRKQIDAATARVDEITESSSAIAVAVEQQQGATDAIACGADVVLGKVSQTDRQSSKLNDVAGHNRALADKTIDLAEKLGNRAQVLNARMEGLLAQLRAA